MNPQRPPQPLPADIREEMAAGLPLDLDEDLRWWFERFVEDVHCRGYGTGFMDGWPAGAAHHERREARRQAALLPSDRPGPGRRHQATVEIEEKSAP